MSSQGLVPIAIVGMSCHFPGKANDPQEFWSLLREGKDAWSEVPKNRFEAKSFHHPSSNKKGTTNHRGGHFLDRDISAFDAAFFAISPAEARAMDPQQRLLLETAYEALENAGMPLESIKGSATAVFAAAFNHDYDRLMYKDINDMPKYHMTGTGDAILANRISYAFDLRGPSMTVDTGCSGSLVAVHQACSCLRARESRMALAGGVNLMLTPDVMISMSDLSVLNSDGKCFTFDKRGSGYGRGEGSVVVVLKRLEDALADGDHIHGVVKDSALNQDGRSDGILQPNAAAQKALMSDLYSRNGISTTEIGYVEAHGTGTVAGDMAELEALSEVFCSGRSPESPLMVGSLKPNVGHLEGVSGLAGLMKAVLILERGEIPPTINIEQFKDNLNLAGGLLQIPRKTLLWPGGASSAAVRIAGVNSFGYGGTNAHCIVESAPRPLSLLANGRRTLNGINGAGSYESETVAEETVPSQQPKLLVLSAFTQVSLKNRIRQLQDWAESGRQDSCSISRLSYTLSCRRTHLPYRASFVASSYASLLEKLQNTKLSFNPQAFPIPVITFVFSGQGAQWYAMGRELIDTFPGFKHSLLKSEAILFGLGCSWSLLEELRRDKASSQVNLGSKSQPMTTAIQIALVDLLERFGVRPSQVLGHSSGEIAAAYTAGALSEHAALAIAFHRGVITEFCSFRQGAMLAVGCSAEEASNVLTEVQDTVNPTVSVACINSPASVTLSGDIESIIRLQTIFENSGIFNRRLAVDVAYHSHHMQAVADLYRHNLHELEFGLPRSTVRFFSTVTAAEKTSGFDANYWVNNLVNPVRFSETLQLAHTTMFSNSSSSHSTKISILVEIGPHKVLEGPIRQTLTSVDPQMSSLMYIPSLVRSENAIATLLKAVGTIFESGRDLNFEAVSAASQSSSDVISNLPPYPWEHQKSYWHDTRIGRKYRYRQDSQHCLIGQRVLESAQPIWRQLLKIEELPWLRDHVVDGQILFPAAAYLCMAMEALFQHLQEITSDAKRLVRFRNVKFNRAILFPHERSIVETQVSLQPKQQFEATQADDWFQFEVSSLSDEIWTLNCQGLVQAEISNTAVDQTAIEQQKRLKTSQVNYYKHKMLNPSIKTIPQADLYPQLKLRGNDYGRAFAILRDVSLDSKIVHATTLASDIEVDGNSGHEGCHFMTPPLLDSLLQPVLLLIFAQSHSGSVVPSTIQDIEISAEASYESGSELEVLAELMSLERRTSVANISAFKKDEENGKLVPVISINEAEFKSLGINTAPEERSVEFRQMTYETQFDVDVDFLSPKILGQSHTENGGENHGLTDRKHIKDKSSILESCARYFAQACLRRVEDENLQLDDKYSHLLRWLQQYRASSASYLNGDTADENSLERLLEIGVEGEALFKVGPALPLIITGKIDALSLLTESDLLYRLYSDESTKRCSQHLARYIQLLRFKQSNLKVLEIGAGTGGTTSVLLNSLSDGRPLSIAQYDFTDISSGFFAKAKTNFADWSQILRFMIYDVEKEPESQGLELESYDLIIAANSLHATHRIDATLSNVRRLLKHTGRLALIEVTQFVPYMNISFGILPGWWNGAEDGRNESPMLTINQWAEKLETCGFSPQRLVVHDYESFLDKESLIVSQNTTDRIVSQEKTLIRIMHQCPNHAPCSTTVEKLRSTYTSRGYFCDVKIWSDLENEADENSETDDSRITYIIMDCINAPLLSTATSSILEKMSVLFHKASTLLWIVERLRGNPNGIAEAGQVAGFARAARSEYSQLRLIVLDSSIRPDHSPDHCFVEVATDLTDQALRYSDEQYRKLESDYLLEDAKMSISRLVLDEETNNTGFGIQRSRNVISASFNDLHHPLKIHVETPGLLQSIEFRPDDSRNAAIDSAELIIEVKACGINFKDVFIALGQMKDTIAMTGECAGTVTAVGQAAALLYKPGDRVCAWNGSPFSTFSRVKHTSAHKIPEGMSFTDATSIPVIFGTAYYALVEKGQLQKDQTILIYAASGGVGQAAIQIAQRIGAEIFAMVGSHEKRKFLQKHYGIPDDHMFSSRSQTFKQALIDATGGRGVDVILNSSSGHILGESWECLAPMGIFLHLGRPDSSRQQLLSMFPFLNGTSFTAVDLVLLASKQPLKMEAILNKVFAMFKSGELSPVKPITVYPLAQIEEAFRFLQSRRHIGKIVLSAEQNEIVRCRPTKMPPIRLPSEATYIIAGGLGRLGREICRALIVRGASHIVILTRAGLNDPRRQKLSEDPEVAAANVSIFKCNVGSKEEVEEVSKYCRTKLPPVRGIIHAAMQLQDRMISRMSHTDYATAILPKVNGTLNLKDAFAQDQPDFFIALSSVAGIIGSRGQANYAAGNTFQDALAHDACKQGDKFYSLSLGVVEADIHQPEFLRERQSFIERAGGIAISIDQVTRLVISAISDQTHKHLSRHIVVGFDRNSISEAEGSQAIRLNSPMFNLLPLPDAKVTSTSNGQGAEDNIDQILTPGGSLESQKENLASLIARRIALLTTIDVEDIKLDVSLSALGLDSLIAVEVRNWISLNLHASISTAEILNAKSIYELARVLVLRMKSNTDHGRVEEHHSDHSEGQTDAVQIKEKKKQPKLPLPTLDNTLRSYLDSIQAFCSSNQSKETAEAIKRSQNSLKYRQKLLEDRAADPLVENWQVELCTSRIWLKNRAPVHPFQTLYGSLREPKEALSQVARAAIIIYETLSFKFRVENGDVEDDQLNEDPLCMDTLPMMFNTMREPLLGKDSVRRYSSENFAIILHRGFFFKVLLIQDGSRFSSTQIAITLQEIVDMDLPQTNSAAVLTADERNKWSKTRAQLMQASSNNRELIGLIDSAAFIVCLDDESPTNATERYNQYLLGDPRNRWCDKTLQFIICANGATAFVCSHSTLDGVVMQKLVEHIYDTSPRHESSLRSLRNDSLKDKHASCPMTRFTFDTDNQLLLDMERIYDDFRKIAKKRSYVNLEFNAYGSNFFRRHKIAPNAGFQVLIQLAWRILSGYSTPSWETVSMRPFQKGRVDVMQTALPSVVEFCDMAHEAHNDETPVKTELHAKFRRATNDLANSLARTSQGQGYARHLVALHEISDDEVPPLFSDPTYLATQPAKMRTDRSPMDSVLLEGGIVMPDLEGVWVHYNVWDDGCSFAIVAVEGRAEAFAKTLEEEATRISDLFI